VFNAAVTVLAAGDGGHLWATTSNPEGATPNSLLAMALRAGATVADTEFAQFHPTVLAPPADRRISSRKQCVARAAICGMPPANASRLWSIDGQHSLGEADGSLHYGSLDGANTSKAR
jgi:succinate dehydrogenase/fumarate reductase flavoprotein subunit